jgi:hypothetical protein
MSISTQYKPNDTISFRDYRDFRDREITSQITSVRIDWGVDDMHIAYWTRSGHVLTAREIRAKLTTEVTNAN